MKAQPSAEFLNSVSDLMQETRTYLEGLYLYPREGRTDSILLGLLSKSVVLTEAIVVLVSKRFNDEAFGLCRSCVEIKLTVRYMTNKDTESRCNRYFKYFMKDKHHWFELIAKYYPQMEIRSQIDMKELEEIAAAYPSPHRWALHILRYFASEESTFETREDGTPVDELFSYEVIYKWMSHYVHVTQPSIEPHITAPGDPFRVHPGVGSSRFGADALRVAFLSVHLNLLRIHRYFKMEYPDDLQGKYDGVVETHVRGRRAHAVESTQ